RKRLPLPPDDEPQDVTRHVAVVAAESVPGPRPDERMPVHQIDHPAHLGPERHLPRRGVVVAARWWLGPHSVQQPQGAIGVGVVPRFEGPIEGRRKNRIDTKRVSTRLGDELEPAMVRRIVGGEFGRKMAWEGDADVDTLHVQRPPPAPYTDLEAIARRPRRHIRVHRPHYGG